MTSHRLHVMALDGYVALRCVTCGLLDLPLSVQPSVTELTEAESQHQTRFGGRG